MADASDRRGFFGDFLREAAHVVRELNEAVRLELEPQPIEDSQPWYEEPPVPGKPASRSVSEDELADLRRELGLEQRRDDVSRLLRPSIRLTRAASSSGSRPASRLGGNPGLPSGFEWPTWQGQQLDFLGQLNLGHVAALEPALELPRQGSLLFFYDAQRRPSGLDPAHRGSGRVVHVDVDPSAVAEAEGRRARFPEYPLELSRELTLPRSWSPLVDALDLDAAELGAWDEFRERLAGAQGLDLEELTPAWQALHRVLGYPEELGSDIELDCQLASSGLDLGEGEGYHDPRREELEAGAADWRLLLQLSDDPDLGASWGEGFGRLYFWTREQDLRAGRFHDVWTITR